VPAVFRACHRSKALRGAAVDIEMSTKGDPPVKIAEHHQQQQDQQPLRPSLSEAPVPSLRKGGSEEANRGVECAIVSPLFFDRSCLHIPCHRRIVATVGLLVGTL
jgi:hypothetical protein